MNTQKIITAIASCILISSSECNAAGNPRIENDFIPAGKWVMSNGDTYCVPKGNRAPNPRRLAAELAAGSSTGDYRWVGMCKILKYTADAHAFSAKLTCSQKSERSGIVNSGPLIIYGAYNKPNEYSITIRDPDQPADPSLDTTIYRKVSDICSLNPRETIVGPKTSIAQPLNPLLQFLTGLPEGTETNVP